MKIVNVWKVNKYGIF